MATLRLTAQQPAQIAGSAGDFGALVERAKQVWRRRKAVWAAHRELQALSDRELDDIGIRRVDIGRIAREAIPD